MSKGRFLYQTNQTRYQNFLKKAGVGVTSGDLPCISFDVLYHNKPEYIQFKGWDLDNSQDNKTFSKGRGRDDPGGITLHFTKGGDLKHLQDLRNFSNGKCEFIPTRTTFYFVFMFLSFRSFSIIKIMSITHTLSNNHLIIKSNEIPQISLVSFFSFPSKYLFIIKKTNPDCTTRHVSLNKL